MKKLLSLFLTATMTLGIAAGCSQSDVNNGDGPEIVIYTGGSSVQKNKK